MLWQMSEIWVMLTVIYINVGDPNVVYMSGEC